jgi:hypothetical protein
MAQQDDFALVRNALLRYRRVAGQHRRGGLVEDHRLAQRALAALERLRQLALPSEQVIHAIDNPPVS